MTKRKRIIVCSNGQVYRTIEEAARAMGGFSRPIKKALNGSQPSAYGLRWHYESKESKK